MIRHPDNTLLATSSGDARLDGGGPRVEQRYGSLATFDSVRASHALDCLTARERDELAAWRDARRRDAWLLARLLGKQLIAYHLRPGCGPTRIEILSRNAEGQSVRPRIGLDGVEQGCALSISHTDRGVLAALCTQAGVALGIDMVADAMLSDGFISWWFTPAEQCWLRETDCPATACFIWAAKEAIYKACNNGESFAPRDVEVLPHERYAYRQQPLVDCELTSTTIDGQLAVTAIINSNHQSIC